MDFLFRLIILVVGWLLIGYLSVWLWFVVIKFEGESRPWEEDDRDNAMKVTLLGPIGAFLIMMMILYGLENSYSRSLKRFQKSEGLVSRLKKAIFPRQT